ncbi:hypothetical protein U1Q18_034413 [Sarracenia purpurea var. burkii]
MGNHISHRSSSSAAGKVILSDGSIHEFDKPLTAAELMLENPQQVVVEFQSAVNGRRPTPLPADKLLEMGKVYLMLPKRQGKAAVISPEKARKLLSMANSVLGSRPLLSSATGFLPLFARICVAGSREVQGFVLNGKERLVGMPEPEEMMMTMKLDENSPDILEGRPEYLSRQLSGKGWKPSLDTIKEKVAKKKVSHWLF